MYCESLKQPVISYSCIYYLVTLEKCGVEVCCFYHISYNPELVDKKVLLLRNSYISGVIFQQRKYSIKAQAFCKKKAVLCKHQGIISSEAAYDHGSCIPPSILKGPLSGLHGTQPGPILHLSSNNSPVCFDRTSRTVMTRISIMTRNGSCLLVSRCIFTRNAWRLFDATEDFLY